MNERLIREIVAMTLVVCALLVAVSLLSHSPLDPSPFHLSTMREEPVNLVGWLGATLSAFLIGLFGIPALLLPVIFAFMGWRILRRDLPQVVGWVTVGWAISLVALSGLTGLACTEIAYRGGALSCGGVTGQALGDLLGGLAGPVGRLVIMLFLLIIGILLLSGLSVERGADTVLERLRARRDRRRLLREEQRRREQDTQDRRRVLDRLGRQVAGATAPAPESVTVKEVEGKGSFRINRRSRTKGDARAEGNADLATGTDALSDGALAGPKTSTARKPRRTATTRKRAEAAGDTAAGPKPAAIQEEFDFVEDLDSYDLPRPSFLEPADEEVHRDSQALMEIGKVVTAKCQEFRVRGEVVNIRTGPVITTYEYQLASGVKIASVQNLAEDLALALSTQSVRIQRIPGRATVGIEVPNPQPEIIRLSQLVEATEFERARSILSLCVGVDIRGKPFVGDLKRMPHLLIGGFTGSGKSVGINAMILSILYKARPDEVKFIFVDPKMVELGVYKDIPHLLTPIITEPKKAANALGWAVTEMDNRYRTLATLGVRNLEQYNQLVRDPVQLKKTLEQFLGDDVDETEFEPLPYIVIIIDELADLMMTSGRAVEEAITRIAQKARAVGLHLICATQRPSVDVLTGIIKANFPCRIAYKVRSRHDSRTILDAIGAEHLIGRGDMLYLPPGTSNIIRLHGPLVTEKEIAAVVRYIKRFGKPEYMKGILTHEPLGGKPGASGGRGGGGGDPEDAFEDPMYEQAARLVVSERKGSASHIQRRLRLGYTRSARLIDMMEQEGIVGPPAGSKGREILVPENYFDEVDETHALNGELDEEEGE